MSFKKISAIIGLMIAITTIVGMLFKVDGRYAKAIDIDQLEQYTQQHIQKVEKRLDLKILQDQLADVRKRIWALEDRYDNNINKMPQETKEEYRKLKEEKKELESKIEKIIEKVEDSN